MALKATDPLGEAIVNQAGKLRHLNALVQVLKKHSAEAKSINWLATDLELLHQDMERNYLNIVKVLAGQETE